MRANIIRRATLDDLPGISRLVRACGFPERSLAGWKWAIFDNPDQGNIAPGWVCEHDGRMAGFLGNFVNRYARDGECFTFATGHTVVTDPAFKRCHAGARLIRHGLSQPDIDAYVTLNNNALSAPLLRRVGARPWLGRAGREWAEWILRPDRAVRALLPCRQDTERFDCPPGFAFRVEAERDGIRFVPLEALSGAPLPVSDSPGAWSRLITMESLRYRQSDPDRAGGMAYVAALQGERVMALAALALTKPSPERLDHAEIVDWAGLSCPQGIHAQASLLRHLVRVARRSGASRLRLHFPAHLPEGVLRAGGVHLRRRHGHDPCHIHARRDDLPDWRPGPGDADYFFAFRIPRALFAGAP